MKNNRRSRQEFAVRKKNTWGLVLQLVCRGCKFGIVLPVSSGGAWCYNPSSEAGEKAFAKITAKEVFFMLEDRVGDIWLGTRNIELYRYDRKTLTNFSE